MAYYCEIIKLFLITKVYSVLRPEFTMINNKRTREVATHFNKTPHDLSDFKFIGIEQIVNDSDSNTIA